MNENEPIDYETEYHKTFDNLMILHDKYKDLEEDYHYYQNLAGKYFEESIKLKKQNKQLKEENEEFKYHIKNLEREVHLEHMRSMFSTVKSFKGDVSKRYYYSEETDTLYDSANNYGQYDKILDKKEVAMLLNEYETLLNNND